MAVPGKCFGRVAGGMQAKTAEKRRIESRPHPHRGLPVSSLSSALVKEPCRSYIAAAEEGVAAGEELSDLPSGDARGPRERRHCSR